MINFKKDFQDSSQKDRVITYDKVIKKVDGATLLENVERTQDLNKGLLYTDFSLQSLIDSDNIDLLNPIGPISRGTLSSTDSLVINSSTLPDALTENKE